MTHPVLLVDDSPEFLGVARQLLEGLRPHVAVHTVTSGTDGDSRGGAALSIRAVVQTPIKFIGIGEKLDALERFYPDRIASRILGMGDIVTLVEKAQEQFDEAKAMKLEEKLRKSQLTLEDFLEQLREVKKMGPLSQVLGMLPGMNKMPSDVKVDENALVRIEADLSETEGAASFVDAAASRLGVLDGLVLAAGGWAGGAPFDQSPAGEWDAMLRTNLDTVAHVCRAAVPHIAAICGVIYCRRRGEQLFHTDIMLFHGFIVGLLFGLEFACIYFGLLYTDAGRSVVFVYLSPFVVTIGAHFFLRGDRLTFLKMLGLILAFAGIFVVFQGKPKAAKGTMIWGDMLQISAAVFWGATTVYIKKFMAEKNSSY